MSEFIAIPMNKLDALSATNTIQDAVDVAFEAQDNALMQVLAMAKLARAALDNEAEDAMLNVGFALDAIMRIAGEASAGLDAAQIAIGDARLAAAALVAAPAQSGRVAPH